MKSCNTLGFSTSRPKYNRWKPSWADIVSSVDFHVCPAGDLVSSMVAPAARGIVAISVAGGAMVGCTVVRTKEETRGALVI